MVCGDRGGRSADENLDGCSHTMGHCDKACDLVSGEDKFCNWSLLRGTLWLLDGVC